MSKECYLFNAFYPYNPGETFLANELDCFEYFSKVWIYPVLSDPVGQNSFHYRAIQKVDIGVVDDGSSFTLKQKARYSVRALFEKEFWREMPLLTRTGRMSFANVLKALRFTAHGRFCADTVLKHICEESKGSEITLYSYWMNLDAYVAALVKQELQKRNIACKLIVRGHRVDIYEYADATQYIPMRQFIFSAADKLCPICDDGYRYLVDTYSVPTDKMSVQRLGTDDQGLRISARSDTFTIFSCAWMRKVKRLDRLAMALEQIDFPVRWIHAGDGEEYENVKRILQENQNPLFSWELLGAKTNEEVYDLYRTRDINCFINVSESEGVPVSIMEAMSFGKIIIATDVGGSSEIVLNAQNGLVLPKDFSQEELIEAVNTIRNLPSDAYNKMSHKSREIWEQRCSAEHNYREFAKLLVEL